MMMRNMRWKRKVRLMMRPGCWKAARGAGGEAREEIRVGTVGHHELRRR